MAKAKKKTGPKWGKITFPVGYKRNLKEFKEEFKDNHVFLAIPENERDAAFEEAHNVATNGNITTAVTAGQPAK